MRNTCLTPGRQPATHPNPSTNLQGLTAQRAFTLIELLVVIAIIAVLIGLLFPVFGGARDQAKRAQAKNDVTQIVNAVTAFYTEYGAYPVSASLTQGGYDVEYGNPDNAQHSNSEVMNALRAIPDQNGGPNANNALNPRQVVFFNGLNVKDPSNPRGGFDSNGEFWDPWGSPGGATSPLGHYIINIDANYNGITSAYTLGYHDLTLDTTPAGVTPSETGFRVGVIAASLGKDQAYGTLSSGGSPPSGDNNLKGSDDVVSWQ